MSTFSDRLMHAWNAFMNKDPTFNTGPAVYDYGSRQNVYGRASDRSMMNTISNRIAMDVAQIDIAHVRLDDEGRFKEKIDSSLNECLDVEANLDQSGRAFKQDIAQSLLTEGCIAIVPVETSNSPLHTGSYEITKMRVGKVIDWYATAVRIDVYDELTGRHQKIVLPKRTVGIVENPLYSIMNEPNSTMQRLVRKLNLLDAIDEQSSAGKLDLIVQLPYVIKSEARKLQAEERRKSIEEQLSGSKYGVAYTDGTERITQLNRPLENNLLKQIEYLTSMLYSQLGITQEVLDGTADEKTMTNYFNRTVEPIISAIVDEMKRKFLTKTARSQKQSIIFFRNPLKLVPITEFAGMADTLTRNEILTKNEVRQSIGFKPSDDPKADMLVNSNISQPNGAFQNGEMTPPGEMEEPVTEEEMKHNVSVMDELDSQLDELEAML